MQSTSAQRQVDVLVVGGGMAGIAAAISAARGGARTLLVEKNGWLGGLGMWGTGLHSFFNIFAAHPGVQRHRVAGGIAQELVHRTCDAGGGIGHVHMERGGDFVSMVTPVDPEVFRLVAARACSEAGVELLFQTVVYDVAASGGHVQHVRVWNKAGLSTISARVYIDCSGDGDVAAAAGGEFVRFGPGDEGAYSAGYTFRLVNVDLRALEADLDRQGLISQLAYAVKPEVNRRELVRLGINMGKLRKQGMEEAPHYFLSSSLRPRELTYVNCLNHGPNDGLHPEHLTASDIDLREKMFKLVSFFRRNFAGCEECYAAGSAAYAGQRRGRAIRCEYELTQRDCTDGARFEDEVGVFSFIDNGKYFVKDGGWYGIPYRCLLPRGLANVMIAGRMMTVETVAHNSTRNTVCASVLGQAAGTAAAMAACDHGIPSDVDVPALQRRLVADGVLLNGVPDPL